jgi:hypothetical protein
MVEARIPPRACLADYTNQAVVDADAQTVSVLYDTAGFVEEFSESLVSAPVTVDVVDDSGTRGDLDLESLGVFDEIADFTCGTAGSISMGDDAPYHVLTGLTGTSIGMTEFGGNVAGSIFAADAPDGSLVELLPGARLVYLTSAEARLTSGDVILLTSVDTVVGSAQVTVQAGVVSDRYTGPQAATFVADIATACPDRDTAPSLIDTHIAVVGTWRITTPDGTVTEFDSAWDTGYY